MVKVKKDYWMLLTSREIEILNLLAKGWSNKQIADALYVTIRTVKFHTNHIYEKIMVNSRSEAIVWLWKYRETQISGDD